uniref:Gamma-interferon-inducible protein 16 n=1 Tax=Sus scrofa TaxID=9823 RepID=A0A4X1VXD3_PIG
MGNEFKRIVLLKGFQHMDDYHFKMIKSLLAHDLRLTRKMQEEYDRIKIADLMEERFRGAACVDKLIELVKGIDDIKHLVKPLQKEKLKVLRRLNAKETASAKKRKQNESSTDESTSATNEASGSESTKNTPMKKNKTTETNESKRRKLTQEESQLPGTSRQLLESATSTQSTESLFQTLQTPAPTPSRISSTKEKKDTTTKANDFKKKVSHKQSQLPGTSAASACPTQSSYQMMQMCLPAPSTSSSVKEEEKKCMFLLKKEGTTTKTVDSSRMKRPPVQSQHPQLSTYSMYSTEACLQMPQMLSPTPASSPLAKKLVCNECLYYEIQDKTGVMEVLVYGRLTSVYCEEGDKLRLTCFELALSGEKRQLRSVIHSFIKVIKARPASGVPVAAQWLTNPTRNHEVAGSVPALAQWVNDPTLP